MKREYFKVSTAMHGVFLFIACLFLVILPAGSSRADCVSDCQASTYCDNSSQYYDCSERLNDCYLRECRQQGSDTDGGSYSGGAHGAIAYDRKTGAYGLADASNSKRGARKSALAYCRENGRKCHVVDSFAKKCAAIAKNDSGAVGWAAHRNRIKAGEKAVKKCNKRRKGDNNCYMTLTNCYSG